MLSRGANRSLIIIRILVGWVFVSEGIQKFLFPEALGFGRLARIGFPVPGFFGPFVGAVEVICGALLIIGWFTRLATIPLLIDISMAIVSTKIPILLGRSFAGFALPKMDHYGWWSMLHEARTDFSMFLGLVFLLITGAGALSIDSLRNRPAPASAARSGAATTRAGGS